MNLFCAHCASNIPAVWLLQGADGRLALLADGEVFALVVARTVEPSPRPLAGFDDDARALAHGPHLEGSEQVQVEDDDGWPAGMRPIAVWEGRTRLLRDLDELGDPARAYLWPHRGAPLASGDRDIPRR
jgi:hypothetical protein